MLAPSRRPDQTGALRDLHRQMRILLGATWMLRRRNVSMRCRRTACTRELCDRPEHASRGRNTDVRTANGNAGATAFALHLPYCRPNCASSGNEAGFNRCSSESLVRISWITDGMHAAPIQKLHSDNFAFARMQTFRLESQNDRVCRPIMLDVSTLREMLHEMQVRRYGGGPA